MSILIRVWDDDGNNRADMIGEVEIPDPRRVRPGTTFTLYVVFNQLTFSCFNYVTQITKYTSFHTVTKALEN